MTELNVIQFAPAAARLRQQRAERAAFLAEWHNPYAGGIEDLWSGVFGYGPAAVVAFH
jgi:hypothetical protein